ncbi:hypothetical protein; putative signal peptide [Bradyrhizobium sp. ORS 278]|uniref:hypothetical protein n=1 Tax=Bradyrhizobium sp. (strain ORS 278) TaxID=114615 RepID=UPI00015083FD|nr:hypothetical protein [Bradyrhizobium sp. ORS 278]CAL80617.1 hypothetical protein; putative signal peptide [Bradyrhizobium sp. ORS 278]
MRNCVVVGLSVIVLGQAYAFSPDNESVVAAFDSPNVKFNDGAVANRGPSYFARLPLPGSPPSKWSLMQWNKSELLDPGGALVNSEGYRDELLGLPLLTFLATNRESRLSIFSDQQNGLVFELESAGGGLTSTGGANLFLSNYSISQLPLSRRLTYEVSLKLTKAKVDAVAFAEAGAVKAQVLTGFTLFYLDPSSRQKTSVFVQLLHSSSAQERAEYRGCFPERGGRNIVFNPILKSDQALRFIVATGAPQHWSYDINQLVCDLAQRMFSCRDDGGRMSDSVGFPQEARDLSNWHLTSMYVGLETQERDLRPGAVVRSRQGSVDVAVQISKLALKYGRESASCLAPKN